MEPNRNKELETWLEIATSSLCSEAKERIRTEIGEHYLDSFEEASQEGVSEQDARASAIRGLGNAKAARRCFRRSHLTELQAKFIKELDRKPPKYRFYLWMVLLGVTATFDISKIEGTFDTVVSVASLSLMMASLAGHFWLAPLLYRRQRVRSSFGMDLLSTWTYFSSLTIGSYIISRNLDGVRNNAVIYAIALVFLMVLLASLWNKLPDRPIRTR